MTTSHVILNNAPIITYTGGSATMLFWGLHLGDVAVILSTLATVAGVALQFYVALSRIGRVEKQQAAQTITSAGNAANTTAVDKRVDDLSDTVSAVCRNSP